MILRKFKTLKSLSRVSLNSFVYTFFMLPIVSVLLKFVSCKKLTSWFGPANAPGDGSKSTEADDRSRLSDIERGFRLGYKYSVLKGACLARSIVLMGLLSRHGIHSQLVIGVQKSGEAFGAHAWLKLEHGMYGPDSFNHQDFISIA